MLTEIIPIITIALLSGFIHGLSGFGSVLISLPLLVFFFDIHTIVPLICLQALCINLTFFIKLRKHLKVREFKLFLISAIPGIFIGIFIFRKVPGDILKIILGVIIVLFAIYLLLNRSFKKELRGIWTLVAGFIAGILGGSIGANGPPVIIYTSIQNWTKDEVKSTITSFLFFAGLITVSLQLFYGFVTVRVLLLLAISIPSLITGMFLGNSLYNGLNDKFYSMVIRILLLLLGFASICSNF
ncbi:MAG: sulfite exporter TauE/SafE family protein [Desulfobacterales bacterium]|nr:sulfite exporter TauE/SafE family protein [Desulfobacterales bacterium]MCP4159628.1 sulfite exporter TauE/SafE family protein [Deltaproteobacteria bacterium]